MPALVTYTKPSGQRWRDSEPQGRFTAQKNRAKPDFVGCCEAVASEGSIAYMLRMKRLLPASALGRPFGYELNGAHAYFGNPECEAGRRALTGSVRSHWLPMARCEGHAA